MGVDRNKMEDIFNKHPNDHRGSADDIIHEWFNTQEDDNQALENLCQALTHRDVKLHRIASQVFDYKTND